MFKKNRINITEKKSGDEITITDLSEKETDSPAPASFLPKKLNSLPLWKKILFPSVALLVVAVLSVFLFSEKIKQADTWPDRVWKLPKKTERISRSTTVSDYFKKENFPLWKIKQMLEKSALFRLDSFPAGGRMVKYFDPANRRRPTYYLFKKNERDNFLFSFSGTPSVEKLTTQKERIHEVQNWTLPDDMMQIMVSEKGAPDLSWEVLGQVEDILSWSIGLRNLRRGDVIRLVWGEDRIAQPDTVFFRSRRIEALALHAQNLDTVLYAIRHQLDDGAAFFDLEGRPWQRRFLHSPVKYARVSSRYNLSRLHPIMKKIKAHRGTDFAAPEGSEIMALADGVVVERRFKGANGNYVKIRHDSIFSTGYLHLSAFAPGLRPGDRVGQGQVIGFVGETGSATGPHVCLRFWRRGEQKDFVRAFPYLPKPPSMPFHERQVFFEKRDTLIALFANDRVNE